MATVSGSRSTLSDTTAQKRSVMDTILTLSVEDIPMTRLCGTGPEATNPKFEWEEDSLFPTSVTIASGLDSDSTTTTASCSSGDTAYLHVGNVLKIDSEYVWVSGISSNTLTIARAQGGTTGATHADASTAYIVGTATKENADPGQMNTMVLSFPYNYPQQFEGYIQVSQMQENTSVYGYGSDMAYQKTMKLKELAIELEKAIFWGQRQLQTADVPYLMGGLEYYITDNVTNCSGAAITQKNILDTVQDMWTDVGPSKFGKTIVCGAWAKRKITDMFQPYVRATMHDKVGGLRIDKIMTDFGELDVLLHPWCPTDKLYILNLEYIKLHPYKGGAWQEVDMPVDGAYKKKRFYGCYTMSVRGDKAHGKVYGFSTSS